MRPPQEAGAGIRVVAGEKPAGVDAANPRLAMKCKSQHGLDMMATLPDALWNAFK